jgi:protein required for attachment to host cells
MKLPKGATIAVVDGETFNLFRNDGDEAGLNLSALAHNEGDGHHNSGNAGRHGSSANPDGGQDAEDSFSKSVADFLNKGVLEGRIAHLLVIAAPRTLGALRREYHGKLSAVLLGEIAKDLTGRGISDLEKAVAAA